MIYARSENEDKEWSLEHVQPVMQSHNILAYILQCQIRHPSILEFKNGIDLLVEITHGIIESAMLIKHYENLVILWETFEVRVCNWLNSSLGRLIKATFKSTILELCLQMTIKKNTWT